VTREVDPQLLTIPPKQIGSDTASSTDEISKSLTQQGDKSAKRVAKRLLSLLSLPHIRDLESWPSGQERRAEVFSTREPLVGSPQGSRKRINGGEKGRTNAVLSSVDATSRFLIRRGAKSLLTTLLALLALPRIGTLPRARHARV
jgi:hypothetical protein